MSPGALDAAETVALSVAVVPEEAEPVFEAVVLPAVTPDCASSCFVSLSSLLMISVSSSVVVIFVPPSVVPASEEMSDRSLESLEDSSEVRSAESLSLPKSDESVLSPVVEVRPRRDDAVRPVPSVLEVDELLLPDELDELLVVDEFDDVETLPAEIVGIEGMEGPDISGMLMLEILLWAASGVRKPNGARSRAIRMSVRKAGVFLQH